ncbi:hypothetical protein DC3_11940 [Deinococcus cellulosilyticus NBRC 106333 = KACC 11606]|uniref:Uncharacterized protein n=1 Tax=Deinococcus cellulosilyticus (strain DSM 18568 / NBRC 106333 / KACC 11606 / 5516J-15) TaxID=1223518 RepID=A0A511MYC0_DEIC1|nr:hypothetical protein DC3_11940 [Deinococcus cellulosilyticus NBRC 106333 = KACC 11606]
MLQDDLREFSRSLHMHQAIQRGLQSDTVFHHHLGLQGRRRWMQHEKSAWLVLQAHHGSLQLKPLVLPIHLHPEWGLVTVCRIWVVQPGFQTLPACHMQEVKEVSFQANMLRPQPIATDPGLLAPQGAGQWEGIQESLCSGSKGICGHSHGVSPSSVSTA